MILSHSAGFLIAIVVFLCMSVVFHSCIPVLHHRMSSTAATRQMNFIMMYVIRIRKDNDAVDNVITAGCV